MTNHTFTWALLPLLTALSLMAFSPVQAQVAPIAGNDIEDIALAKTVTADTLYRIGISGVCGVVKDDHILVTQIIPGSPADGNVLVNDQVRALQYRSVGSGLEGIHKTVAKRYGRLGRDWDWHLYLTVERPSLRQGKGNQLTFDLRMPRPTTNQYHFGPTGFFGKIHEGYLEVDHVAKGSPSDGKLMGGDHIISVDNTPIQGDVFSLFTERIDHAESTQGEGKLALRIRRLNGPKAPLQEYDVELNLAVLGSYAESAPIKCPKTNTIITQTADAIITSGKYGKLNISLLALLSTGEKAYIEHVGKVIHQAKWAQPDIETNFGKGMVSWNYSYQAIILSEYYLLTKDEFVLPALKKYANQIARGQDAAGLWNHRMANPDANFGKLHGRLYGYAAINQTSVALWIGMILARECGINDPEVNAAIDKTHNLYSYWIERGKLPYGNHGAGEDFFTNNGTSGSLAVGFGLLNDEAGASFFSRLSAAAGTEVLTGHTGPWFNIFWSGIGANVTGPETTKAYNQNLHWLRTITRTWDNQFLHMEARWCKPGDHGLGSSGAYLMNLAAGRRALRTTGRDMSNDLWLDAKTAQETVAAGTINYASKTVEELVQLLGHPLPPVRLRTAEMLAIKDASITDDVMTLLAKGTRNQRIGALHAISSLKIDSALNDLITIVEDVKDDLWIRQLALRKMTVLEGGSRYAPRVLTLLAAEKNYDVQGRFDEDLGDALVKLTNADPYAANLDRDLLYTAVNTLLNSKRQNARGSGMSLVTKIPIEDLYRVVDQMVYVIEDKDRTYVSYHGDGHRQAGLDILYGLGIDESLDLTVNTIKEPVGRGIRGRNRKAMLETFGGEAKRIIPKIKEVLGKDADDVVKTIEAAKTERTMISLDEAKKLGKEVGK